MGTVKPAENWRVANGRTEIGIDIAPGETLLLALNKGVDLEDGHEVNKEFPTTSPIQKDENKREK